MLQSCVGNSGISRKFLDRSLKYLVFFKKDKQEIKNLLLWTIIRNYTEI